jgi:selenocysteine lyase/cysteine desulfurase
MVAADGAVSAPSYKRLFSRVLKAAPGRMHFAAHSHHLWPDASYEGHVQAWEDAAHFADKKWDKIFGEVIPTAQSHISNELRLPDPNTIAFAPNTHELFVRLFSAKRANGPLDVLTSDGEFHAFRRQAERWEEDGFIRRRIVPCEPFESFTERFAGAAREKAPDIAFLSHIMFKSGLRFDGIEDLAALAQPNGTWIVLDCYHSFMAIPADFLPVADRVFLIGGGYKYAMAGEGAAYLHCPTGFALRPANTGWFASFGTMEGKQEGVGYAAGGARFLGATYDPTGLYRFNAVRSMLNAEKLTTDAITQRVAALRTQIERAIEAGACGVLREAELLRPNAAGPQGRFISLRDPRAVEWKAKLMDADIVTDARDDVLRIGLGLYHDERDVAPFCDAVKRVLS